DDPLDDDDFDEGVVLATDLVELGQQPPKVVRPWGCDFLAHAGDVNKRRCVPIRNSAQAECSRCSRKSITRQFAFFSTYGTVLPRLNSPNLLLYGNPMTMRSAPHSTASSTSAGPVSRACTSSVSTGSWEAAASFSTSSRIFSPRSTTSSSTAPRGSDRFTSMMCTPYSRPPCGSVIRQASRT